MNCLILVRGLPGSGKSTFAKALAAVGFAHFEADMFHERDGVYGWKPENVKAAHAWCFEQARIAMADGRNVVVSNTFTRRWEMQSYKEAAASFSVPVHVVEMRGNFGNVHGVPQSVVDEMSARWETA